MQSTTYSPEFISDKFGTVKIRPPETLVAGTYNTLQFEVEIGEYGIDDSGHLKIAWPVTSSFGIPQFDHPDQENYTTVEIKGDAKIKYDFDHSGYVRPFKPCITVKVWDGSLRKGDSFIVTMGNKSQGSEGLLVQTYVENMVQFKVLLDPFGTNDYTELPDSPFVDIVPDAPHSLTIKAISQLALNTSGWLTVRANDKWGNTATSFTGTVTVNDQTGEFKKSYSITEQDHGVIRVDDLLFGKTGIYHLYAKDEQIRKEATSNPIDVLDEAPELSLFWGDLHGQTGETVGSGTIDEYLTFGRDVAGVDYISHAANAFQVTKAIWAKTQKAIKQFHIPHRYVTFLGYEWSGVTSAGGDHNVYYLEDDQPIHRCSHALIEDKSDLDTDRYPVSELYKEFEGRKDVLIIPHIGGRRATLDVFDEDLSPFIEIVSVHGHFQWFADEAMDLGLKTGFICSSDTHSGRPGDTFPVTYIEAVPTGLTATYARELTRKSLWDAFKQRHVYGTTGARILLEFFCNDKMMGDEIQVAGPIEFRCKVIGTAPIERVEIIRGTELFHQPILLEDKEIDPNKLIVRWTGALTQFRRKNADWSGKITVHNGTLVSVTPYAFDLPWEGIIKQSESELEFVSTTAGDYDAMMLEIDGSSDTKVEFSTNLASFIVNPQKIQEPMRIDAGGIELAVEVLPVYRQSYPTTVEFTFSASNYDGGKGAYYVRVQQTDGEKAWSSPIFVNWT